MIQRIKNFLDCQTLPEKYFGLPEFLTRQYQILQMGEQSPPPAPLSPTPMAMITDHRPHIRELGLRRIMKQELQNQIFEHEDSLYQQT